MKYFICTTVPHFNQRYETCGDYIDRGRMVQFRISKTEEDYESLVFLHEFIEYTLAVKRGIDLKSIDKFDMQYTGKGEPGDSPDSPYRKEHQFAEKLEKEFAKELGVDWEKYCKVIDAL